MGAESIPYKISTNIHADDMRLFEMRSTKLEKIALSAICLMAFPGVAISASALLSVGMFNEFVQQCKRGYYALQHKQVIEVENGSLFSHYRVIG